MKRSALSVVATYVVFHCFASSTAQGQFVLVDDFESYTVGGIDGQSNGIGTWVADQPYEIAVEPGTTNQVLNTPSDPDNLNASSNYSNLQIDEGDVGTLFFRFQRGGDDSHLIFGLSPAEDPVAFGDFEASISARTPGNPGRLQVRSGGSYVTVEDFFELEEWINIWMVIDNDVDEFQVYAQSDTTFPDQQLLDDGTTDIFVFRNGTPDPLTTFYLRTGLNHEGHFYIDDIFLDPSGENLEVPSADQNPRLQAGDADMDLDFDQLDLVQVQIAAKYLTGQSATWGEGDWDAAPGGEPGNPPIGNGLFDQLDIISALASGTYLTGPYAAIQPGGATGDGQTSIVYNPATGEVAVDAPAGLRLTSINIDSAAGVFTGEAAQNLGGSFDNDADDNIFKATFGGSFGSLSLGHVAQQGLAEDFVLSDFSVVGSLEGGGGLGDVDLVYVPEPSAAILLILGLFAGIVRGPFRKGVN